MLIEGHPSKVEPLSVQSQHLSLPPPLDFFDIEVALVSLNTGLFDLDVSGNVCWSRGLPCLFQQVGSRKGNVVDSVCLRNDDLRSKLASVVSGKIPTSSMGSLGVVTIPRCSEWAIVVKGGKQVPLPYFFPSLSSSSSELRGAVLVFIRGKMLYLLRWMGGTWVVWIGEVLLLI